MAEIDIRWKQRFENYKKALERLNEAAGIIVARVDYGAEINYEQEMNKIMQED